jgi:replicative DNA helicase
VIVHNSGAIEQDADIVIFLSRPDYQLDAEGRVKLDPALQDDVYITIAKHRNGSTEEIVLKFVKDIQTFFSQDNYECHKKFGVKNAHGPDLYQPVGNYQPVNKTKDDLPF